MYYSHPYHPTLGKTANSKRILKSGSEYDVLFPKGKQIKKTVARDADVYETLDLMKDVVNRTLDQTKAITRQIQAECGAQTGPIFYKALFDFVYNHIQYIEDEDGYEDLSEPALLWANRRHGGDCDCFTIFILSCLANAGVTEKYARIIRMLDDNGRPKDYFQHVYVVVPKSPKADMSDPKQYWVIDPVMDEFNDEPKPIVEKFDKPMVQVRVLSGLGCPDTAKQTDSETEALLAERKLIAAGAHPFICTNVQRENAIAAIDYWLKYKDDPTLRESALAILQERATEILPKLHSGLGASTASNLIDQGAYRALDALVAPGVGVGIQALGIKPSNLLSLSKAGNAIKNIFSGGGSKNNNNAALRAELDKFDIPENFNVDLYISKNPDVANWANQQGLNDAGYVRKLIAMHYFTNGINEGRPYPYKQGYGPKITVGMFDWIGGQDNGTSVGIHVGDHSFKPGDKILLNVFNGETKYTGTHIIKYLGADDGTYQTSMVTISAPKSVGKQASGTWQVADDNAQVTVVKPDAGNSGISPVVGVGLLTAIGIAVKSIFF